MKLVEALIDASIPDFPALVLADDKLVRERVAVAAATQLRAAPFHIRFALAVMLATFAAFVLVTHGCSAARLPRWRRSAALSRFSASTPPTFSAMERLIRSVSLLAYCEQFEVLTALGYQPVAERQERRRRERNRSS